MILCDIGNSTFHFLIEDNEFKIGVEKELESQYFDLFNDKIYFISVNEIATKKLESKFPNAINLKDFVSLETHYSETLGIDRVVACLLFEDAIIVDFGSAITIDVMDNNIHMGGCILPGIDALSEIYPKISPKLSFEFKTNIDFDRLPQSTDEAITFAILKMIVSTIEDFQKKYNKKLIITGETAKQFLPYLDRYEFHARVLFDSMKNIIANINTKKEDEDRR